MGLLWSLIVGALIGAIAGAITNRGKAMSCIANIFAGLVGSWAGQALFGSWGPSLAGMALLPSILGAVIVVAVIFFFFGEN
ncbi:GlsB/YeaQ/YmgE family stress response membrane protein [Streptococcus mutans]|uniref:GlsB/YeaQ/YmgE family stress response membrane protein n=1 Tax=Streptococcus mutans TaxID=1309 RepID=UPI0014557230|nr:GlsB/YeaQ/YmgE family stress response membrane protein [Streptococcus mutans]NLQ99779.1 GlsB/YeaQ/YmgE family stress response membrane protein [Streptococcus mutans]